MLVTNFTKKAFLVDKTKNTIKKTPQTWALLSQKLFYHAFFINASKNMAHFMYFHKKAKIYTKIKYFDPNFSTEHLKYISYTL